VLPEPLLDELLEDWAQAGRDGRTARAQRMATAKRMAERVGDNVIEKVSCLQV
jgi:hypothetical protein